MKNVTLAIPDDLLAKAREYAKKNGTTLNEMIRDLIKRNISREDDFEKGLEELRNTLKVDSKSKMNREDIYER